MKSALTWPLFNYRLAVLYVFSHVEKLDGGTFRTFPGQSVVCPDPVQGEAQAEEEEVGAAGRQGPGGGRGNAAGDLHLGNDEGRERDVGRQRRAVRVDKGFDLLCLLVAGLDLQSFWRVIHRSDEDDNLRFNAEVAKHVTLWDRHMHADSLKYFQNCYWFLVCYLGNSIQFFFVK